MIFKEYYFDVEIIIDYPLYKISTHHMRRGLKLKELNELIKENLIPKDETRKITINIRGVNY